MKKIYSKPETCVVTVNVACHFMAGSPGAKTEGYNAASEVLSRGSNDWDDEDF
ncbi:MAG: hypothetical protein K6G08_10080 [Prevotella sp.]|nr:hypothetical protein [Prevotella sp.]